MKITVGAKIALQENLSEYMRNVDALVNKEYIKSQNQSGRDAACI